MRKLLVVPLVVLMSVLGGTGAAADDLSAMTNADRTRRGLPALATASDLQSFAQRRAEEMATAKNLWHTNDLGGQIGNWRRVGENVGRGPDLREIHTAFMESATHRENILHPSFSQIGVGVAHDGGKHLYVAVIFRQPKTGPAPPPPPAPAPAPTPAPAPAPAPVPAPPPPPKAAVPRAAPATTAPPPTTTTTLAPPPPQPAAEPAPAPMPEVEVAGESLTGGRPSDDDRRSVKANQWDGALPSAPADSRSYPPVLGAALILAGVAGTALLRGRRLSPLDQPDEDLDSAGDGGGAGGP